jgi:hypothetical protein
MLAKPTAHKLWEARVSECEARAMPQHDEQQRNLAREEGLLVRARIHVFRTKREQLRPSP